MSCICRRPPPATERARAYWEARLDTLPPAPALPLAVDPSRLADPRFGRLHARAGPGRLERAQGPRRRGRADAFEPALDRLCRGPGHLGPLRRLHLEPHGGRSTSAASRRRGDARRLHQPHAARDPRRLPRQLPRSRARAAAPTGARSRSSRGERRRSAAHARPASRRSPCRAAAGGLHQRDRRSPGRSAGGRASTSSTASPRRRRPGSTTRSTNSTAGWGSTGTHRWRCSRPACWTRCSRPIVALLRRTRRIGCGVGGHRPIARPGRGARPHRRSQRHRRPSAQRPAARAGVCRRRGRIRKRSP